MKTANHIRKDVIRMLARKNTGNTASNLSSVDILTALYFNIIKNPRLSQDRVIVTENLLPAWHTTLAHSGHFSKKWLFQPTKDLPEGAANGHGISIAIGSALAAKIDAKNHKTYCIITDFEHQQGQTWEAIMLAGKYKLNNITVIVDRNNTQADGYTENIMPLEPLRAKYEAFNWHTIEVDGHNIEHITEALKEAGTITTKPTVIIAHTIPGKGVSFIENNYEWHTKTPTKQQEKEALEELQNENN